MKDYVIIKSSETHLYNRDVDFSFFFFFFFFILERKREKEKKKERKRGRSIDGLQVRFFVKGDFDGRYGMGRCAGGQGCREFDLEVEGGVVGWGVY